MNFKKGNQKICLKKFIPKEIITVKTKNKYSINIYERMSDYLFLEYFTNVSNHLVRNVGKRKYSLLMPKYLNANLETFEVIGLLQAEMTKVQNGCIQFANHEVEIINQILRWFEKEFEFSRKDWKWYIKININEPKNLNYKSKIEKKVVDFWLTQTRLNEDNAYPKKVSYVSKTSNKKLKFFDYGTIILEHSNNLLSQILKNFVKETSSLILNFDTKEIRSFMRGIIAGESNVELNRSKQIYRVSICSKNSHERLLFQDCLKKLFIDSKYYPNFPSLIISRKANLLKLFDQKLMCRSRKKYNKFLKIIKVYNRNAKGF